MDLTDIDDLPPDELREGIEQLRKALDRKLGQGPRADKARLKELLSTEGDNFFGSNLSMSDYLTCLTLDGVSRALIMQDRPERRRRMGFVIKLAAELERIIQEVGLYATGLAEGAIEDVILGDWRSVHYYATDFCTFKDEHEDTRDRYGPAYASFAALLQEAFDTRPEAEEKPRITH